MNTSIKTIAAAVILSAAFIGPASAMISQHDLSSQISSSISSGNVQARVNGNTVTLSGYVSDAFDKNRVVNTAMNFAGVARVIDLTTTSN